jgi:hypothetical protein
LFHPHARAPQGRLAAIFARRREPAGSFSSADVYSHIIIDEDGVGGGVVDQMQGVMAKNPLAAPSHSSDAIY